MIDDRFKLNKIFRTTIVRILESKRNDIHILKIIDKDQDV